MTAPCGRLDRRQGLGAGDPQLQLADAGEVLVQLLPVGAAQPVVQAPGVFQDGVEHAGPQAVPLEAVGVVGPVGEEALEDEPGVDLGRQGGGRRSPGDRVLVDARIAAVAVAGAAVALDAELQRGQPGVVAEPAGGDLVGRDAGPEVGPGGLPRLAAGQEGRRGAGVVAAAVAVWPALVAGQAAEHQQVVPERGQRLQDGGELEAGPLGRGRPVGHDARRWARRGRPCDGAVRPRRRRPATLGSIASRKGRATAVPTPRRIVRLEIRPPSLMAGPLAWFASGTVRS